jgi:hypothetical protein
VEQLGCHDHSSHANRKAVLLPIVPSNVGIGDRSARKRAEEVDHFQPHRARGAWIPSTHVKLTHVSVVCFTIHSSSPNSRAELRFSGSHCSILGKGMPAQKSPLKKLVLQEKTQLQIRHSPSSEKNLLLRLARASRLGGGGPKSAIISERWAIPRYALCSGSRPVNKCSPSKASQTYKRVRLCPIECVHLIATYHTPHIPDIHAVGPRNI